VEEGYEERSEVMRSSRRHSALSTQHLVGRSCGNKLSGYEERFEAIWGSGQQAAQAGAVEEGTKSILK